MQGPKAMVVCATLALALSSTAAWAGRGGLEDEIAPEGCLTLEMEAAPSTGHAGQQSTIRGLLTNCGSTPAHAVARLRVVVSGFPAAFHGPTQSFQLAAGQEVTRAATFRVPPFLRGRAMTVILSAVDQHSGYATEETLTYRIAR
jgi:hypothetical protein